MKVLGCNMKTYPENRLDGLLDLTDETGIIQHTKFSIIDRRYGYCTDDNARALIASLRYHQIFGGNESLNLSKIYLMFLLNMCRNDGKFHNFLGYNRDYQDEEGTEDSLGHTLWALGKTMNSNATEEMKKLAKWLFDNSLPHARKFTSPRAKAFTILGLSEYHETYPSDTNIQHDIRLFADHLVDQYHKESCADWKWFEGYLTYANARLPQSLMKAYGVIGDMDYLTVCLESFDYLMEIQFEDSVFQPIGTKGWYKKGGVKSKFDQQPIEASCMVDAALDFGEITEEGRYAKVALDSFHWYYGKNTENISLINISNFTCYDGLTQEGLNLNQGAESTISYYLAYLKLKQCELV
jgi:hypothetical protein